MILAHTVGGADAAARPTSASGCGSSAGGWRRRRHSGTGRTRATSTCRSTVSCWLLLAMTPGLETSIHQVRTGRHTLLAEFVANDHGPFRHRVVASVQFTVR